MTFADSRVDLSWLRVLVAEDDIQVMRYLRGMLSDMGVVQASFAKDGAVALDLLTTSATAFHLVVADWNMPKLSGLQLLQKVRAFDPAVAFMVLTGRVDQESVAQAREQGVDAYLQKPFSADQLRTKLLILSKRVQVTAKRSAAG